MEEEVNTNTVVFYGIDLSDGSDRTAYWLYNADKNIGCEITEEEYNDLVRRATS